MLPFKLPKNGDSRTKILCLGAHSDDIEIGAGGTILQLLSENQDVEVVWAVFSAAGTEREREARASADLFLKSCKNQEVVVHGFRDGYFPYEGARVKDCFEDLKKRISPDLIFTHYRNDRHQDHRTMCDLTWNTPPGRNGNFCKIDLDAGTFVSRRKKRGRCLRAAKI